MSDHERGAYTPPTDAPLAFEARAPVRGARPFPVTLVVSVVVLLGLSAAIFIFYRSGVRQAGAPPQVVGTPVGGLKSAPAPGAQPQDAAAGLEIYHSETGQRPQMAPRSPQFVPPPEQPQARPQPHPPVVLTPAAPAAQTPPSAQLRPAQNPPSAQPVSAASAKPAPKPPAPAPTKTDEAMVQIGAVSSPALADKTWNEAVALAPGLAAGKGKGVERIEKDGKTLYRTFVTGFVDHDAAQVFCGKLKAAGKACFVK